MLSTDWIARESAIGKNGAASEISGFDDALQFFIEIR